MGFANIWIAVVIAGVHLTSGNLDFVTVYRLPNNGYSSKVTKEYHRQTKARNMLLKTRDNFLIDSVQGMMPLNCSPASENCQWSKSTGWQYEEIDLSEEEHFTIKIDENYTSFQSFSNCDDNNGGCQVLCSMENGKPECSCPLHYSLSNDTCHSVQGITFNLPGTYKLEIENNLYYLIISPPHSFIKLNITTPSYSSPHVREFLKNGAFIDIQGYNNEYISSRNMLYVVIQMDYYRYESWMDIPISNFEFKRTLLTLKAEQGSLSYITHMDTSHSLCVSVIYSSPTNKGSMVLKAKVNGSTIESSGITEHVFGRWKINRFKITLEKYTEESIHLLLNVSGNETTIHSIFGCSAYGNQETTIMLFDPSLPAHVTYENTTELYRNYVRNSESQCNNGGQYNNSLQKCVCPTGLMGEKCEEGCGPNAFGNECTEVCSDFSWGCSGMIFCKKNLSCLCASGYTGKRCDEQCTPGFYGPSCIQECGNCFQDFCDTFTGKCYTGCKAGYRLPFCNTPYKYPEYAPQISHQDMAYVTVEQNFTSTKGDGNIKFYQIQYKITKGIYSDIWTEMQPRKVDDTITVNITNLRPGTAYDIRTVFIDEDGNSYQGELIPTTQFVTSCAVPTSADYNVTSTTTTSSIEVLWKYTTETEIACPATGYSVLLQRDWKKIQHNVSADQGSFLFENLLSGVYYTVRVRVLTRFGNAMFSAPISVKTKDNAPLHISDLQVSTNGSDRLIVSWKAPKFTAGSLEEYYVQYQCVKFAACSEDCNEEPVERRVAGNQHSILLEGLRPHVQYSVSVAAKSYDIGPYSVAYGLTDEAVPETYPEMSERPVLTTTNTSITTQWLPPKNCRLLNGYMVGYHYQLTSPQNIIIQSGETVHRNITVKDLVPQTTYKMEIRVVCTGGMNMNEKLIITASTAATVPDMVQDLTVYKRGRRIVGMRWELPLNTYGEITTFSVSHCRLGNCGEPIKEEIPPKRCAAWPESYCHTISNLVSNTRYSFSVSARNNYVAEDGNPAKIISATTESVPEAPLSLRILYRTSQSVTLEWQAPRMFNGVLRSFLLNVEQEDSANASNCCSYFPLQEIPVKKEEEKYTFEVTDLAPASKYMVSVSAKTIAIGPSSFIMINTPPEMPELQPPQIIEHNRIRVPAGPHISDVTGTYLLLLLTPDKNVTSIIWNTEISEKLRGAVNSSFYMVEEYDEEQMTSPFEVEIGKGSGPRNGTIGMLEDPLLPDLYQVGLALVLKYNGATNVGFVSCDDIVRAGEFTEA